MTARDLNALRPGDLVALYCDCLGWNLIPASKDKRPAGMLWKRFQTTRLTPAERVKLTRHVERGEPAFLVCGEISAGVIVLDLDTKHDPEIVERWRARLNGEWDRIPKAITPSGGYHLFFAADKTVASQKGTGWDLQANGKGVVVPSGNGERSWEVPPGDALPDYALIEDLIQQDTADARTRLKQDDRERSTKPTLADLLANSACEGGRNDWLARVSGHYARAFDRWPDYEHHVVEASRCTDPPMDEAEALTTARSIWTAEQSKRTDATSARQVLDEAQVDLIALIREGIPTREYVPGCEPWLIRGKRYLLPAPAGTGKSLVGLIAAVAVVRAGGIVVVIDVENGEDEYARRLEALLASVQGDGLEEACVERLRYFAWPRLSKKWTDDAWADAIRAFDADLVIFDSSRMVLSSIGLAEDSNDDYAEFAHKLLFPLSRQSITTIVLDNTGHLDKGRARGATSKQDLNEVVYSVEARKPFDVGTRGELVLRCQRQRFGDLPRTLIVPIGGGVYGPISVGEVTHARVSDDDQVRHKVKMVVQRAPGITKRDLRKAVSGHGGAAVDAAVEGLVSDGRLRVERDGTAHRHYAVPIKGDGGDHA